MMAHLIELVLVLVLLLNYMVLVSSRLRPCIRAVALQGALLGLLPLLLRADALSAHALVLAIGILGLKGILFPWLLFRVLREASMQWNIAPLIGFTTSLLLGAGATAMAFMLASRLPLPPSIASSLLVPCALTTILVSFLMLVSRTKALMQVVGYLMLENGIFLFGLTLVHEIPFLIELGVLLDLFVGVFVMGIVVYHINREFDHIDTYQLTALKG